MGSETDAEVKDDFQFLAHTSGLIEAPYTERKKTEEEHIWEKDCLRCQWYIKVSCRISFRICGSDLHVSLRLKFWLCLYIAGI